MAELAVGIDLGTSNSCVAIARGGEVEVLRNAYGEPTTASVVAFLDDGMIEVGNHAKANIIHDPINTICSAKRLIGRYFFSEEVKKAQAICAYEIVEGSSQGVQVIARDEEFSLSEISAMVLREMKQVAETALGEPVTKAVITVPAYFNDNQRQATKDAGRIAGLEVLRILNEPTAAALAYGFGRGLNQRVAVYDLGGGTFDVSVLEIGKDIFEVLSTCGDTFLGGDDFDDRLIDLLADEVVASIDLNPRTDPFAFEKIKAAAENAKKTLSREASVEIRIPDLVTAADGTPYTLERTITSEEYSSLVMDLVVRTFKVCDEALQQADLTTSDLDGVILVGGPTRLPVIRQSVSEYFQRDLKDDVDPDAVVAKGAAIHAASLVSDAGPQEHDAFLLDVTPLDLRIGVAGGLAEPVIERNTPIPIEQTRRFTTTRDNQESVQIKVYQGAERMAEQNELLGQFEFSGFRKANRGDVAIDVTFEINADGIVDVSAYDPDSEQRSSTTLSLSSGLTGGELDQIIEDDRTARVKTDAPEASAPPQPAADDSAIPEAPAVPNPDEPFDDFAREALAQPAQPLSETPALEVDDDTETAEPELDIGGEDLLTAEPELEIGEPDMLDAQPELEIGGDDLLASEPVLEGAEDEVSGDSTEELEIAPPTASPAAATAASAPPESEVEIDDASLLELADEIFAEDAGAMTDAPPETGAADKHELFDTGNVDLSAGTRED